MDVASVSGIAGQSLRGFFKGWLRNEARDPVQLILVLASWWDFRQKLKSLQNQTASTFEKVFQKLELFEELAQRGRTSEEGPACGGARRVRTAAGALNNPQYVRRCVEAAAAAEARADAAHPDKAAAREARQLLERSLEDAPGLPCFSYATGHASPASVVAALRGRGFAAARSAYDGDASKLGSSRRVRTDAPAAVFAEVLEQVVRPAQA